jgi:hypothetical protein
MAGIILSSLVFKLLKPRDPQIFQKSRSLLQSLGARTVTNDKFHTKDPNFLSDL